MVPVMVTEILEKMATDVKATVQETCAKVAEMHFLKRPAGSDFERGYDRAAREIAERIRSM
jgi:hypothetical protein